MFCLFFVESRELSYSEPILNWTLVLDFNPKREKGLLSLWSVDALLADNLVHDGSPKHLVKDFFLWGSFHAMLNSVHKEIAKLLHIHLLIHIDFLTVVILEGKMNCLFRWKKKKKKERKKRKEKKNLSNSSPSKLDKMAPNHKTCPLREEGFQKVPEAGRRCSTLAEYPPSPR